MANFTVTCQCGKKYSVPETFIGKKGKCKHCGGIFVAKPDEEVVEFTEAVVTQVPTIPKNIGEEQFPKFFDKASPASVSPISQENLPVEATRHKPAIQSEQKDMLGIFLLLLPAIGILWMLAVVEQSMLINASGYLNIGVFLIVATSAVLIGIDANRLLPSPLPKEEKNGVTSWVIGTILLWIIYYPWWMFRRKRYGSYIKSFGWWVLILVIIHVVIFIYDAILIEDKLNQVRRLFNR
ncbi:MAG: hypothetical protein A2W23_04190 [Planctomycetes bacterium RBG_16_43_13]|nr:MAG: hypothetical protein A2W23_04190 [Planctomycetes bacterium RBG_16_43_13]